MDTELNVLSAKSFFNTSFSVFISSVRKQDSDKCEEILLVTVFVWLMPDNENQQDFLLINPKVSQGAIRDRWATQVMIR